MDEELSIIDLESLVNETKSLTDFLKYIFKNRIEPIKEFPPYITILEKISKNFDSMSYILESIIKTND